MTPARSLRASLSLAAAALLITAGAAAAVTLDERDLPGGAFGSRFDAPTVVAPGVTTIVGTGGVASNDYFRFSGLPTGVQTLSFSFSAPASVDWSYSFGGAILIKDSPFAYAWDGLRPTPDINLNYDVRDQRIDLTLPETFAGVLDLALNFTHGAGAAYVIDLPGFAPVPLPEAVGPEGVAPGEVVGRGDAVAAVPVPAAAALLPLGLGALVLMRRRRRSV